MIYCIYATRRYRKQFRKVIRQGKSKEKIEEIINWLRCKQPIPLRYKIHSLSGEYQHYKELHIEPDLLLMYAYHENIGILELYSIGSHSELFKS